MSEVTRCDHTSVGTIIRDRDNRFLLLTRRKFPKGIAPSAGHIDDHVSPEQAALDEVREELGLTIALQDLHPSPIQQRHVGNPCRREDGDHHTWWVYEASTFSGELRPSAVETKGAAWYTPEELQALADRAQTYRSGKIPDADWEANPGLEPTWLDFMTELGYVALSASPGPEPA